MPHRPLYVPLCWRSSAIFDSSHSLCYSFYRPRKDESLSRARLLRALNLGPPVYDTHEWTCAGVASDLTTWASQTDNSKVCAARSTLCYCWSLESRLLKVRNRAAKIKRHIACVVFYVLGLYRFCDRNTICSTCAGFNHARLSDMTSPHLILKLLPIGDHGIMTIFDHFWCNFVIEL